MCLLSIGGSRCSVDDFAVTNLVRFTSIVRDDAMVFFCAVRVGVKMFPIG